jgi:hypothetical protein
LRPEGLDGMGNALQKMASIHTELRPAGALLTDQGP